MKWEALFTRLPTRWLLGNLASRKKPEAWKRAEVPRQAATLQSLVSRPLLVLQVPTGLLRLLLFIAVCFDPTMPSHERKVHHGLET
jgi:hypothetical protein